MLSCKSCTSYPTDLELGHATAFGQWNVSSHGLYYDQAEVFTTLVQFASVYAPTFCTRAA